LGNFASQGLVQMGRGSVEVLDFELLKAYTLR
jgi:hypothetical protein